MGVDELFNLNRTGSVWDRSQRNNTNDNWDKIESVIKDRGVEILSDQAFLDWLFENGIKHREEVQSFSDLPSNDSLNTVRGVADDNKIYIKKEDGWVPFQSIDVNKINEVERKLEESTSFVHLANFPRLSVETTDTGRIKRAIEFCEDNDKLVADNKEAPFYINDTIYINKNIDVDFYGDVIYSGSRDRAVFHLRGSVGSTFNFKKISDEGSYDNYQIGYHEWQNDLYCGILAENLRETYVNVIEIINFTQGFNSRAIDGFGFWFNHINVLRMTNCKDSHVMESSGEGSWVNGNHYYNSSCGFSGSEFLNDTQQKHTFYQKLTNGNDYGGNSNIFYNFKFEVGGNSAKNWTQIELSKAMGFQFIDYRYENLSDSPFVVMDLSEQDPTQNNVTHSHSNIFKPAYVLGYEHKINFVNTGSPKAPYSEIAKIYDSRDYELYRVQDLKSKYRRVHDNQHLLKGLYRKRTTKLNLTSEESFDYSPSNLAVDNGVLVTTTYPIATYVEGVKKGDEFEVLFNATTGRELSTIRVIAYDSNGNSIASLSDSNAIALRGRVINDVFVTNGVNIRQLFTVNHSEVETVCILVNGYIDGFSIKSNNKNSVIKKSMNPKWNNTDQLFFYTQPNRGIDGNFDVGDIVLNTNESSDQPYAWQFLGDGWTILATRN